MFARPGVRTGSGGGGDGAAGLLRRRGSVEQRSSPRCCLHIVEPIITLSPCNLQLAEVTALPDPCPLPGSQKRRGLGDKDRLLYAPMADVGGLLYDQDAVYIDIPDWKVRESRCRFTRPMSCAAMCHGHPQLVTSD